MELNDDSQRTNAVSPLEADRLAEGRRLRTIAQLPGSLLPDNPRDNDHYDDLVNGVTAPHWNSAVALLQSGPQGYLALLQMRDRLDKHLEKEQRVYERADVTRRVAVRVCQIAQAEAKRYGGATTLYASFRDERDTTGDWEWTPDSSGLSFGQLPRPADMPDRYCLTDAEVSGLLGQYDALQDRDSPPFPRSLLSFDPEYTWGDFERVAAGHCRRPTDDWRERRTDLIEFRLSVVEQVLREHEVLGYVGEYGESPRPVELDEEQEEKLIFNIQWAEYSIG